MIMKMMKKQILHDHHNNLISLQMLNLCQFVLYRIYAWLRQYYRQQYRQIDQMTTIMPNASIENPSQITISDQIHPQHQETSQTTIPAPFIIHPMQEEPMRKNIKEIKDKRVFSWSNIIISLSLMIILSVTIYLYWPQTKQENKIGDITKSLMDISQLQSKQPIIAHPNDGSSTGSTSSSSPPSNRNDKSHRSTGAIPKSQSYYRGTIIGSDNPGDDEGDDEQDPNNKKNKDCGCGGGIYTDPQEDDDSQQMDDSDDDEYMEEDDQEMNWLSYPDDPRPLVGNMRP